MDSSSGSRKSFRRDNGVALGISLRVDGVFPLALLIPMSFQLHAAIVLREEAYLRRKFRPPYEAYLKAVPRWL